MLYFYFFIESASGLVACCLLGVGRVGTQLGCHGNGVSDSNSAFGRVETPKKTANSTKVSNCYRQAPVTVQIWKAWRKIGCVFLL